MKPKAFSSTCDFNAEGKEPPNGPLPRRVLKAFADGKELELRVRVNDQRALKHHHPLRNEERCKGCQNATTRSIPGHWMSTRHLRRVIVRRCNDAMLTLRGSSFPRHSRRHVPVLPTRHHQRNPERGGEVKEMASAKGPDRRNAVRSSDEIGSGRGINGLNAKLRTSSPHVPGSRPVATRSAS